MKPALQRLEPVLAEGDQKRIADMLAPTPELATLLGVSALARSLLTADRNGSQLARVSHATWPDADE
jgi:hypothetical protein